MATPRILVVDDEEAIGAVLKDFFEMEGYDVQVCCDVASASERLEVSSFDAALVDIFLTEEPVGVDLGKRILSERPETGLVFMTGYAEEADIRSGYLFGAHACIRKPFVLDDVRRVIGTAIDSARGSPPG
jgi:DNA-binding response OmpR family regulator